MNIKITNQNVRRIAESVLYQVLDRVSETSEVGQIISQELERRFDREQVQLRDQQIREHLALVEKQRIEQEMALLFKKYKGTKTKFLVDALGEEFVLDYELDTETFIVYSYAKHYFDQQSQWDHATLAEATHHIHLLIYYRIYDKFMRNATNDYLALLTKALS